MVDEIVKDAILGNKQAFSNLVIAYQNDFYKIAKCILSSEEDICIAIEESLITAYNSILNLKDKNSFKKWIINILINKSNSIYEKNNKVDYINNNSIETDINFYNLIKDFKIQERLILTLFYTEGYSEKEIAKILSLDYLVVRDKIQKLEIKLKEILRNSEECGENFNSKLKRKFIQNIETPSNYDEIIKNTIEKIYDIKN